MAATTASISDRKSTDATVFRTSSRNSRWSFQMRPMIEAFENWSPVSASTRLRAALNVSELAWVSRPRSSRIARPASNKSDRNSARCNRC